MKKKELSEKEKEEIRSSIMKITETEFFSKYTKKEKQWLKELKEKYTQLSPEDRLNILFK